MDKCKTKLPKLDILLYKVSSREKFFFVNIKRTQLVGHLDFRGVVGG